MKLNPGDNVAVVGNASTLEVGAEVFPGLFALDALKFGQKVALENIKITEEITRYGVCIGYAKTDIKAGSRVSEVNINPPSVENLRNLDLKGIIDFTDEIEVKPFRRQTPFFMGYRNDDGSVGTRNCLAISSSVHCVSGVVKQAVSQIESELLPQYPNVDGVVFLDHAYGCGVAIDADGASVPINTIRNLARNPNFGGQIMLVGLGCEKLRHSMLDIEKADLISLQDSSASGYQAMLSDILRQAEKHLTLLNLRTREKCPLSALTVGVQCGGSDSISGMTANPLVGELSDFIVAQGGSIIFSEITEVRDGAHELLSRCTSLEVKEKLLQEFIWYDDYLQSGGVGHSANTTPGNRAGGISNIVEKAMGSLAKSGRQPIVDIIRAGDSIATKGLNFLAGPASDFISGTLQFAAGANLHIFTTGRGTPYSIDGFPTVKVSSNSELARRWWDLIDFDAGPIIEHGHELVDLRDDLVEKIIAVASGEKTSAEKLGISNSIVLFNPAPIT